MVKPGSLLASFGFSLLALIAFEAKGDDLDATKWKAKVDPPATALPKPTSTDYAIPFPTIQSGGEALYPTTPSSFVALGKNFFPNDMRQVWDLSTKKLVGTFKGPLKYDEKTLALSSDGAYLAGKPTFQNAVEVRATKNGRVVQTFDYDSPFLDFIDFAGKDRVVFGRVQDRKLQVSDIKSGDKVCTVSLFEKADKEAIAMSPGRNYLALASWSDGTLRVYDLAEGDLVAEAPTPKKNRQNIRCFGLSYSPDGSELAGLFEYFGEYRIVCWSASNGKMLADFDLGKTLQRPTFYDGQGIGWLPDGSSLLVLGYAIIDRTSGKKIWDLPFDRDNLKPSTRRFLDNDHALVITSKPALALRTADIPRDKIAGAAKIVREGGNAADASLPALIKADLTAAKTVDFRGKNPTWGVTPKGTAPAEVRLTARPLVLKGKPDEYRAVLFGGPGSSQAVAVGTPQQFGTPNPTDGQPRWIERFDLAGGKSLGKVDLPNVVDPIALSPDGSTVLLREAKAKDRIDVVTAADGKPVAGWRPYEQGSAEEKAVVWAAYLDPNRLLTVSSGGTLILWSLPQVKAVYIAEDAFIGAPSLSSDKTLIVGFDGRGLRVLDAETGAWKGEGAMPSGLGQRAELKSIAVRPDGLEVAALFKNFILARWDMKTGRVTSQFPFQTMFGESLDWAGNNHVLIDHHLMVDLGTKLEVWNFVGGAPIRPVGSAGPDGRHWTIVRGVLGQETGRLASFEPIDPSLEKAEALLADPAAPSLLRPGSKVTLQINANPVKDAQAFRQAISDGLAARFKRYGINFSGEGGSSNPRGNSTQVAYVQKVAPEARMVLSVRDNDTGKTIEYRRMGAGRGPVQVVKLVDLVCEFQLLDALGGVVWSDKRTQAMQPFGFVLRMPQGETDPEVYLKKLQWGHVKDWAANVSPPYFIARDGKEIVQLPGFTDLNR